MSVGLICPSCGNGVTFHRVPVTICPSCNVAFPESLRAAVEASLQRQTVPRPTLLTVGQYLSPAFGALCLMETCAAVSNSSWVTFSVNGERVSGHEFFATAGPGLLAIGTLSLAIAYGIWRERPWSRWAIVGFWLAGIALNIGLGWSEGGLSEAAAGIAGLATVLLGVGWYLFGKENVVDYYRALERSDAARRRADSPTSGRG